MPNSSSPIAVSPLSMQWLGVRGQWGVVSPCQLGSNHQPLTTQHDYAVTVSSRAKGFATPPLSCNHCFASPGIISQKISRRLPSGSKK
jgi:hypothetical protein